MAEQAEYRYDVFISYSQADADWVRGWLLPRLKAAGLTVCLDRECFEPGAPLLEETERVIRESRHILAVLSPEWVADQWDNFEALLVHYHDPTAHFRRLIPILLEACQPPEHIQLLHWVDFSQAEGREAQLARVVQALRDVSALPELRPYPIPAPRQRRWELRWMALAGAAALVTLIVLLGWIFWQARGPSAMPEGDFNIAVAEFSAVDEAGRPVAGDETGQLLSTSIAHWLEDNSEAFHQIAGERVNVWGPDQKVRPVAAGDEERRAQELRARVLVYGTLRQQSQDTWRVEPAFYLTDQAVGQAEELRGEHALGTPIAYQPASQASKRNTNETLRKRVKALALMLMGLSSFECADQAGYQEAANIFEQVAQDPDWGAAEDGTGQEVLHLFLGSAYLKQVYFLQDGSEQQSHLLQEGLAEYRKALELNGGYARAYNGLGTGLFQVARPPADDVDAVCDWDWDLLAQAFQAYRQALDAPQAAKPPSAYVDLRARVGLGNICLFRGGCRPDQWPDDWQAARTYYEAAADEYEADPQPYLRGAAIAAYTGLGNLAYFSATDLAAQGGGPPPERAAPLLLEATQAYSRALQLTYAQRKPEDMQHAITYMPYALDAYCLDGRVEQAGAILDEFVAAMSKVESVCADRPQKDQAALDALAAMMADPQRVRDQIISDLGVFGMCPQRGRIR
jgi:hypothetical protein